MLELRRPGGRGEGAYEIVLTWALVSFFQVCRSLEPRPLTGAESQLAKQRLSQGQPRLRRLLVRLAAWRALQSTVFFWLAC